MCPRFDSGLHHPISDQIGCMLKAIMRITDFDAAWPGTSFNQTLSLLDHVAEFVSQHPLSGLCPRGILSGAKQDMFAHSKSACAQRPVCVRAGLIVRDSHLTKIMAKPRLHKGTSILIKRLAWRGEEALDDLGPRGFGPAEDFHL